MKSNSPFSRYNILWMVILWYLIPVVSLLAYRFTFDQHHRDWETLSIGLLLAMGGSLAIFWLMTRWEASLKRMPVPSHKIETATPPPIDLEQHQASNHALNKAIDMNQQLETKIQLLTQKIEELSLQNGKSQEESQHAIAELELHRNSSYDQLAQQQHLIRELQDTIAEQKNLLEKRQQQVGHLETKVGDLTYEIKTLLKLAEAHTSLEENDPIKENPSSNYAGTRMKSDEPIRTQEKRITTAEEASLQLKRCLDISQKITGSHRFNSHANAFIDSTADSFTIDLRRLCDSLRSEMGCGILLYSPKDHQLLFVNNHIKTLTGWNPEKFSQNFSEILQDGIAWKQGISNLAIRNEIQMKLALKTKTSQETSVMAHLGMIPTGIFRHHAIAVLYTAN